jgi:hypothetical protein
MNADLESLEKLLNHIASLNIDHMDKVADLGSQELEKRTTTLERLARGLGLDLEMLANFDLPGIEAKNVDEFVREVYYRFFGDEKPLGPERLP